jgi:hypothetical protein
MGRQASPGDAGAGDDDRRAARRGVIMKSLFVLLFVLLGCGPKSTTPPSKPAGGGTIPERVVAEFERTVLAGRAEWETIFDFAEIGAFEILLHRYDLLGRLPNLDEDTKKIYASEDGTPYPAERERRNVGNFYTFLAQRTVGTGGCTAGEPKWDYNKLMGKPFEPLPPGHESYEPLRLRVNAQIENGGVVAIRCTGGRGGLALVWSTRDTPRGWDIVTIYDDGVP